MENSGVLCDVQTCSHNIDCRKCDLSQIKITHHTQNPSAGVENPHYCQSYEEKCPPYPRSRTAPPRKLPSAAGPFFLGSGAGRQAHRCFSLG